MKKFNVFENKQYITSVNESYIFFTLADGSQIRLPVNLADLHNVYKWYLDEIKFYDRMYQELTDSYNKQYEACKQNNHYYTADEIEIADWNVRITMEISNSRYIERYNMISGISQEASRILNMLNNYREISKQIQTICKKYLNS